MFVAIFPRRHTRGGLAGIITLCVCLGVGAGPASGQASDTDNGATPPTFAEVLENPGDTGLVFRYARHKIEQGELPAAASALDQILVQNPDLHTVRVVYGIVLYRLGNLQGAQAELQRADAKALPAELGNKRTRYLERIARDQQSVLGELTLTAGLAYETNASAAPESGEAVVFDIPLDVGDAEDDLAYSAGVRGRLEHKLATSTPITIWGEATGQARDYVEVDSQDLRYLDIAAGARIRTLQLDVIPAFRVGGLLLSGETFYRFAGPEVRLEHPLDGKATLFAEGRWYAESFEPIAESQTAGDRSGQRIEALAGAKAVPRPDLLLKGFVQITDKRARENFEDYTGAQLVAEGTYRVFNDHFVQLRGAAGVRNYEDNDPFFSAKTRRDDFYRVRLGYGLPVPGAEKIASELDGLTIVPSVTYYRQNSNIRNFEYENVTASVMLRKKFDF